MNPSSRKPRLLSGQVIPSNELFSKEWIMEGAIAEYLRLEYPPDQDIGQILVIYGVLSCCPCLPCSLKCTRC